VRSEILARPGDPGGGGNLQRTVRVGARGFCWPRRSGGDVSNDLQRLALGGRVLFNLPGRKNLTSPSRNNPQFGSGGTRINCVEKCLGRSKQLVWPRLSDKYSEKVGAFYVTFLPQFIPAGVRNQQADVLVHSRRCRVQARSRRT